MTTAREKFGGQKGEQQIYLLQSLAEVDCLAGISSDMYFGRGNFDPVASTEAQGRLQQFQGATAISSNAYFGRPEDDEDEGGGGPMSPGGDGMLGLGDNDTIAGLERGIRDMAGKVMANPDVQNLADQVRQGALKVRLDWPVLEALFYRDYVEKRLRRKITGVNHRGC